MERKRHCQTGARLTFATLYTSQVSAVCVIKLYFIEIIIMSPPSELSFEEILKFMLAHNGKVTNHELVKYFRVFLMNPDMRGES